MKFPLLLAPLLLPACATVVSGGEQEITIETTPVTNARCTLTNSKGTWEVASTPETFLIERAYDDLNIACTKGANVAEVDEPSRAAAPFWFNVVAGGVIGMGVDAYTGKGFKYAETISVPLGDDVAAAEDDAAENPDAPQFATAEIAEEDEDAPITNLEPAAGPITPPEVSAAEALIDFQ